MHYDFNSFYFKWQRVLNTRKVHLFYLDSLRGIAAILVVFHHSLLQVNFQGDTLNVFQVAFLRLFRDGHYPVNFFIVLSGYCLMLPVIKLNYTLPQGIRTFFGRRAKRILPPYFLAMAASLVLIFTLVGEKTGTHWDVSIPVTKQDIITHILLIQDFFTSTSGKINHSFWSISVEWRIYFLFPILLWFWRTIGATRTLLITAILVTIMLAALKLLHQHYPLLNNNPSGIVPHFILLFALGMLGADIAFSQKYHELHRLKTKHWMLCLASLFAIANFLIKITSTYNIYIPWQFIDVLNGLMGVCLLLICNNIQHEPNGRYDALKAAISWKPLATIGTFAYSIYLIHAPLLQLLSQYMLIPLSMSPFISFLLLITVGLLFVLVISYVFFLLCEKPFMTRPQPPAAVVTLAKHTL